MTNVKGAAKAFGWVCIFNELSDEKLAGLLIGAGFSDTTPNRIINHLRKAGLVMRNRNGNWVLTDHVVKMISRRTNGGEVTATATVEPEPTLQQAMVTGASGKSYLVTYNGDRQWLAYEKVGGNWIATNAKAAAIDCGADHIHRSTGQVATTQQAWGQIWNRAD